MSLASVLLKKNIIFSQSELSKENYKIAIDARNINSIFISKIIDKHFKSFPFLFTIKYWSVQHIESSIFAEDKFRLTLIIETHFSIN
jgi:hypothetical protein